MTVPPDLTVRRVAELVGEDTPLAVIDVPSQSNLPGWTLGKWRDYYETDYSKRDRIRNVISLEISDSELGKQIERPQFVRDMDLVSKVWDAHEEATYPKVTLYCLMSVRDSYTDFHIDFGGSSVFYHICKGAKTFLFIPPTESNLKKYEKWCNSSDQNTTFFANLTDVCYRVDLSQGDSMLIPSGWIHAVHTPEDSVVIGGNFLTPINMETQVRLAQIERNTKVPRKFQFPHFNRVMWYTARHYKNRIEANETVSYYERKGLGSLLGYLNDIVAQHDSVPKFIGDGKHFLSELEELCKSLEFKAEEDTLKNPDIRQRSPPTLKDEDPDSQELSAPLTEEDSSKDPDSRKRSPPLLMKEEVQLKKSKTE
ncbi:hypothetical protein TRVA0_002S01838 [Trichomonascus vanleenenianus]|uniref:[Histone H3]-lysine-36 demethylase n=1 Tax=Trichomonascus vanleenenianus TaxID=2268995 RepID=UPI003ECA16E4